MTEMYPLDRVLSIPLDTPWINRTVAIDETVWSPFKLPLTPSKMWTDQSTQSIYLQSSFQHRLQNSSDLPLIVKSHLIKDSLDFLDSSVWSYDLLYEYTVDTPAGSWQQRPFPFPTNHEAIATMEGIMNGIVYMINGMVLVLADL